MADEEAQTENEQTEEVDQEQEVDAVVEEEKDADTKVKVKVEYKAPTEAQWKAQQEKTKRANAQAAAHRREADELKRKSETEDEATARKYKEEAQGEVEKKWRPLYVKQAARAALTEAGVLGPAERLLKLIDVDSIQIDDDGEIDGLDAQVREIKKDYPALFGKRTPARVDQSDRGRDEGRSGGLSTASQRLLDQQRGR